MNDLSIENLHFAYVKGQDVLKGITLDLKGASTAIIGQNGAGKSTLVKLLKGLIKPDKGTIKLNGEDIVDSTAAELSRHIGMVFQNPNDQIFKNKVINEVMFGPLNIGQSEEEAHANAFNALERVGLSHHADENPYDLSLSERKMISIASILAMDTDVVIFDEPTMGQDFAGKEILKTIISDLQNEGKLVLCILHDMDFAAEVFEQMIVLNEGKVLLDGLTHDVFTNKDVLKEAHLDQPSIMHVAEQFGVTDTYVTEGDLVNRLAKVLGH